MTQSAIHLGAGPLLAAGAPVEGGTVALAGERFYRIRHVDAMPPFLMSIVSASDLWMFVSSTGGLTAGRVDADGALFPYATADKLTENAEHTGPKTLLRVTREGRRSSWEPFSDRGRGLYRVERNLYKNALGNQVVFEERNLDLRLGFRYAWRASDAFGFVRTAWLIELAGAPCTVEVLDGLQNLMPAGATAAMQNDLSSLLDAYKRNELEPKTGLGLFTLSSTLTDLAEPSESLRATTVFAVGLDGARRLLSSAQVERFRRGDEVVEERDVRGRRGAYFVRADLALAAGATRRWHLVADVGRDHAGVVALLGALERGAPEDGGATLEARLDAEARRCDDALSAIVASGDGFQWTRDQEATDHHLASVLFNLMRGGVFLNGYTVARDDLVDFVRIRNPKVLAAHRAFFAALPTTVRYRELVERAAQEDAPDLERLCAAYLPLAFGRRHGDPSRPWNRFTINIRDAEGRPRLDYQGNWRDVFQNWEALGYAFPGFATGMIGVFLSATTADGYNPYRITRDGIEWEAPEPGHPWSNIGYWSDHQVVYLQKLLELAERFDPDALTGLLDHRVFSHANVPYRIRPYAAMLDDAYDTIEFDHALARRIAAAIASEGTDARLLRGSDGAVVHVTMAEKLLLLLLVKLANLVPEGGVWMNTQRPEWNDANNALVGKGLSVVTTAYLYRTVAYLQRLLADRPAVALSREVRSFFDAVHEGLNAHADALDGAFDDHRRRAFMDALGDAGSRYRQAVYEHGFAGGSTNLDSATLAAFLELARRYLEHTLRANRRPDALYHAYNVLALTEDGAAIHRLDEMLEGQVAVLSSGLLSSTESLELLASLRHGRLYRADQHSYVLYPDRDLPGFLAKNRVPPDAVRGSKLLTSLLEQGDRRVVVRDERGDVRFHGSFRNAKSVRRALADLAREEAWSALVATEGEAVAALFERVFDHASFTGRSGTFFAYEGLGSIYWHMVSKLMLAVQECHHRALAAGEPTEHVAALAAAYVDVRAGLGFHKTPEVFGAFPADPYSHTPAHAGAQQPGMTGQVKEDVLARLGELGVEVRDGRLGFAPALLANEEFLAEATTATVWTLDGPVALPLEPGTLAFTICQVPVVYRRTDGAPEVTVLRCDGGLRRFDGAFLDAATSREVFERTGAVARLEVDVPAGALIDATP
ncbi:MAG: hypothetical protein P1P87_00335 [Trueperaceae bacterium]|nr:hypothetical protein [Trueperaceae bacterium]